MQGFTAYTTLYKAAEQSYLHTLLVEETVALYPAFTSASWLSKPTLPSANLGEKAYVVLVRHAVH